MHCYMKHGSLLYVLVHSGTCMLLLHVVYFNALYASWYIKRGVYRRKILCHKILESCDITQDSLPI